MKDDQLEEMKATRRHYASCFNCSICIVVLSFIMAVLGAYLAIATTIVPFFCLGVAVALIGIGLSCQHLRTAADEYLLRTKEDAKIMAYESKKRRRRR